MYWNAVLIETLMSEIAKMTQHLHQIWQALGSNVSKYQFMLTKDGLQLIIYFLVSELPIRIPLTEVADMVACLATLICDIYLHPPFHVRGISMLSCLLSMLSCASSKSLVRQRMKEEIVGVSRICHLQCLIAHNHWHYKMFPFHFSKVSWSKK